MMEDTRVGWNEMDPFYTKASYNGVQIWIRKDDRYIYANQLNSEVRQYLRSKKWKGVVEYWENRVSVNLHGPQNAILKASYTVTSGEVEHRGTYIHPDLVHFIAEQVSIEYAFAVKEIMDCVNEVMPLKADADPQAVIALLEKRNDYLEKKVSEQKKEIDTNFKIIETQEKRIVENRERIYNQDQKIHEQDQKIHEQDQKIEDQDQTIHEQDHTIRETGVDSSN
jgi:hypothetical protein